MHVICFSAVIIFVKGKLPFCAGLTAGVDQWSLTTEKLLQPVSQW